MGTLGQQCSQRVLDSPRAGSSEACPDEVPVRGKNNPADVFTKAVSGKLREKHLKRLGFRHVFPSEKHKDLLGQ